jgi:RNA ligase (TIGR02306 family)
MRKMAHIERVIKIEPIVNADSIEVAKVLGWQLIVRKGEFKEEDFGVFFEIDSLLPIDPRYEFLRKNCFKKLQDGSEGFKLRTMRLRGTLSQGLLLPLSSFPELSGMIEGTINEGDDVSEILKVTKWEPPIPAIMGSSIVRISTFPPYCPKTDEIRIQAEPGLIEELKGKSVYITQKVNGTNATFLRYEGEIHVCTRNNSIKDEGDNVYWKMYRKYGIDKLFESRDNIAIQGEIVGPGIQKNPMGLNECCLYVFNVFDILGGKYLDYPDFIVFCLKNNLTMVPLIKEDMFNWTMEELLEMAKGKYKTSGKEQEGIVIRPIVEAYSEILKGRLSVKVVNNDYLLKETE